MPFASCSSRTPCVSSGSSRRRRPVSASHSGMLAGEEERTRLARPAGCVSAYSIASIPPQDEPNRWMRSRPRASRIAWTSADEQLDRPEVGGLLDPGAAAADLVVEDDPAAGGGELLQRLEVVVQRTGTAVQAEQRQLARLLAFADDAVPGLAACVRDGALGRHPRESTPGLRGGRGADRASCCRRMRSIRPFGPPGRVSAPRPEGPRRMASIRLRVRSSSASVASRISSSETSTKSSRCSRRICCGSSKPILVASPSAAVCISSCAMPPFCPRAVGGRRGLGLDADHAKLGPKRSGGDACPGRSAAAADRHDQRRRDRAAARAPRACACRRRRSGAARFPSGRSGSRAPPRAPRSARGRRRSRARARRSRRRGPGSTATFTGFAPSGTQMTVRTPKSRPAKAIDWPWLPVDAVITPRRRSSSESCETRLTPPRTLKLQTGWWFSCLTQVSAPTSSSRAG